MKMYSKQVNQANHDAENHKMDTQSISYRIFATNWGLAVIGGLVALAIGVSSIHAGHVASPSPEVPEVEAETVSVMPLSVSAD